MAKKTYTIEITRVSLWSDNKVRYETGTLEELIRYFGYTLECGKSWQNEPGNKKINTNPRTAKSLVANLNKASANSCRSYQSHYYDLVEEVA